jgi:hypothetical protein
MMTTDFAYNNGDRARDRISRLQGIITSRADHLFGCNRYWVSPEEHKDGKVEGGGWFDEDQLELLDARVIVPRVRVGAIAAVPECEPLRKTGGSDLPPITTSRGAR